MSLPVFHASGEQLRTTDLVVLDGAEGRHASVVRRLRVGERVVLTDGHGLVAQGTVVNIDRSTLTVAVQARQDVPRPEPALVVIQALPKGERGELAVELMTEVGVDVIIPWSASRCVARWEGERAERGLARWRTAARAAAKQSRRVWWPEIGSLVSTPEVAGRIAGAELGLVLDGGAATSLARSMAPTTGEVVVVVGPEGGITEEETERFVEAGAAVVRAGPTVLRTSTAGLVAATVILSGGGRWATG